MVKEQISETMVVRDLVVEYPGMRELLEGLGIDYCCGGKHTLKEAALEKHVDVKQLLANLNRALAAPLVPGVAPKDWSKSSLTALVDHIESTHHIFMKEQLPRLENILAKAIRAHGNHHGAMLESLRDVFMPFRAEIDAHLFKEEMILFPAIRQAERNASSGGMLVGPVRQMELEHDSAGQALAKMRELTSGYQLPPDACPTFAALYDGLKAVEADLHEHIHLENNILFPRVLA